MSKPVFVFGSNLAGRHGKGAALAALQNWGAIYGQGVGRQGNSYAIPTKSERLSVLPPWRIKAFIREFIDYARLHADETFLVTQVGCGLAGYTPKVIAPMFKGAPSNCILPVGWREMNAEN